MLSPVFSTSLPRPFHVLHPLRRNMDVSNISSVATTAIFRVFIVVSFIRVLIYIKKIDYAQFTSIDIVSQLSNEYIFDEIEQPLW